MSNLSELGHLYFNVWIRQHFKKKVVEKENLVLWWSLGNRELGQISCMPGGAHQSEITSINCRVQCSLVK